MDELTFTLLLTTTSPTDAEAWAETYCVGEWIAGSEERVRYLSAEMRRRIFERAVQQRVDAAEAAFPRAG